MGGLAIGVSAKTETVFPYQHKMEHMEQANPDTIKVMFNELNVNFIGKILVLRPETKPTSIKEVTPSTGTNIPVKQGIVSPTHLLPDSSPVFIAPHDAHFFKPPTSIKEVTPSTGTNIPVKQGIVSPTHLPIHYFGSSANYYRHISPTNSIANDNINLTYEIGKQMGLSNAQIGCVDNIFANESGFMPNAVNPGGAAGIPQRDPGNGLNYQPAKVQIRWGIDYMNSHYGSGIDNGPCNAWIHWQSVAADNGGAGSY